MTRSLSIILLALTLTGCPVRVQDPALQGVHFLKFHADWCGPCKTQKPIVKRLKRVFGDVQFHNIDIDKQTDWAQRYGVSSIPCMVIVVDGVEQERFLGTRSYEDLSDALKKYRGTSVAANP